MRLLRLISFYARLGAFLTSLPSQGQDPPSKIRGERLIMQTSPPALITICWGHRLMQAAAAFALLLAFGFAQPALAQNAPSLVLTNNYFVTGDYVVGGWVKTSSDGTFSTGRISIPDTVKQPFPQAGVPTTVPAGADIVAAFLYWETVQSSNAGAATGAQGFFGPVNNDGSVSSYAITGTFLPSPTPNAPTSWSSGGCSGSSQGSKTIQAYRADVRPFLPLGANGKIQANGSYQVKLADTGSNGNTIPFTLGATLVIIYRVQSPLVPLNSIALYDGTFAPSNASPTMSQTIQGFYLPATSPVAKITHIVGAGQPNKTEQVFFNTSPLNPLGTTAFPGTYNGSWDNPTWNVTADVLAQDSEMTSVVPTGNNTNNTNGKCVDWGAVVFSTTVDDSDGDGLLDVWKSNKGYTDVISRQWVALPGAKSGQRDLFVEIDYLNNLDGSAGPYLHSHLPKQAAIDKVGDALCLRDSVTHLCRGVNVHFDLGPGIYQGDPYVISYPVSMPPGVPTFPGAGGNAISEGATIGNLPVFVCTDGATLCEFPSTPASTPPVFEPTVGWKGGFIIVRDTEPNPNSTPPVPLLGNFEPGRALSYHYVLAGHGLGAARTYWIAAGEAPNLTGKGIATLVSIVANSNVGTVTLTTPPLLLKPGDAACSDANCDRVTVGGALQAQNAALNGTYKFYTAPSSTFNSATNMFTTTFKIQIPAPGVADGTYDFFSEPQLGLAYGGPTSGSGRSEIGGGDSMAMTFGFWPADDPPNCQPDPSQPLNLILMPPQTYCVNQVGTVTQQAGVLLHELGHANFLTHGGTLLPNEAGAVQSGALAGQYQNSPPVVPSYGLNCNPGFLSSMNYLFVFRGFPDVLADGSHPIGYSGQTLPDVSETALDEGKGIGSDKFTGATAAHFTRWFAPPNALDIQLQNTTGGRFATLHCDGTPIGPYEPPVVRVDGSTSTEPSGFSGPIDWNNDLIVPDLTEPVAWQDVNFNGSTLASPDSPFPGFNDWVNFDLRQIGARESAFGFSGGGGAGGLGSAGGAGGLGSAGGGPEQDVETACSTADPPTGLSAVQSGHTVVLNWTAPEGCQVQRYDIWRAEGTFTTPPSVVKNSALFKHIGAVTGTPPLTTFTDNSKLKNNTTYTYFVTDTNKQAAQSGASGTFTVSVSF